MFAVDGSGRPPDMRIKAIIRTPVHPPPTNATINHQAETILAPVSHGLANCQVFLPRPGYADFRRLLTNPATAGLCFLAVRRADTMFVNLDLNSTT